MSFFEITHKDKASGARTGIIHTDHGDIETPIFMPVGTQATVKSLDSEDIDEIGAQIILANTYHLHLRPGEDLIDSFGGVHKFMDYDKPMLTDSGGFQVFSLGKQLADKEGEHKALVHIDDDGVDFRSHIDGSQHRFTAESAIDIQHKLGADIIMAFDECTPDDADEAYAKRALKRTHEWAQRSIDAHKKNTTHHGYRQFLFGIVQGAQHKHLREESARVISSMDFDGIAIGGESIGYNMEATKEILDWVNPIIPEDKPHYTMGVGLRPSDLFHVVERGIDMFDCVAPTRIARNGSLFISPKTRNALGLAKDKETISITNSRFKDDKAVVDEFMRHPKHDKISRAYLHHLFKANELLAFRIATEHNLYFLLDLMRQMREAIREDRFLELKQEWCD